MDHSLTLPLHNLERADFKLFLRLCLGLLKMYSPAPIMTTMLNIGLNPVLTPEDEQRPSPMACFPYLGKVLATLTVYFVSLVT